MPIDPKKYVSINGDQYVFGGKATGTGGGEVTSVNGQTGAVVITASDLGVPDLIANSIGSILQVDLTGTYANQILTFEPNAGETVTLENNKNYEFDLIFPAVGTIPDNTVMQIKDSSNNIFNVYINKTVATFGLMSQIMNVSAESGMRWIFLAIAGIAGNIYNIDLLGVINPQNINNYCLTFISNTEMLDALSDGKYNGKILNNSDIFMCSDDNGYLQGHVYKFTINAGVFDWVDLTPVPATTAFDFAEVTAVDAASGTVSCKPIVNGAYGTEVTAVPYTAAKPTGV